MAAKAFRWLFLLWIVGGFIALVVIPMTIKTSSCPVDHLNGWTAQTGSSNHTNFFCDTKITDWTLVFFTYALVVVGWFTLRSNEQTAVDTERAYIFLSHKEPGIDNGFVALELQTVNQGRMFGVLKEIKYKFIRELPKTPADAQWEWEVMDYDWTLPAGIRRDMGYKKSDLTGRHYLAGCVTYQDAFTRQIHTSWTTIEFNPGTDGAGNKRGGGEPWNKWD